MYFIPALPETFLWIFQTGKTSAGLEHIRRKIRFIIFSPTAPITTATSPLLIEIDT